MGFKDIEISVDEKTMEADVQIQYLNKANPMDVLRLIKAVREKALVSEKSLKILDKLMLESATGDNKIKAGLPEDLVVGHKTGMSSRKPHGVRITDNDAGFVFLPDGSVYYIAIFVTESQMSDAQNAALMAQVSNTIYKHLYKQ